MVMHSEFADRVKYEYGVTTPLNGRVEGLTAQYY